ncbi:Uncharacterized conserved protein, DUF2147 family [Robiginitalea myxolifaciens]|uniref:Uncharacterized conserved protein, DUF2147 family n=1 Tax=Robiginitalea myxolifaciens TaxID=400055 RepID=A0A1I6HAZ8_9FLAO|nr:DUF2147 domain-containing protein [Robiginitalea myxolifaciens]SFR51633.1 Uncharacterized conserved protein, DUF2147 family [Robiginitalea myxolifaciens]
MKSYKKLFLLLAFALLSSPAFSQKADDILGIWMPSEGTSYIQIFKAKDSGKYNGRIVWLKEPNDESGNPKTDPNGDEILRMVNLKDFVFEEDEWTDGTIYDPKSGNLYYCTIEMVKKDKLEVRGSIDPFGLVGRTDVWVRMKTK